MLLRQRENGVQTMEGREQGLVFTCTSLLQSLEAVLSISYESYAPDEGRERYSCGTGSEEAALNAFWYTVCLSCAFYLLR